MQTNRSLYAKIAFGLFLILWGAALLVFGPFYSRGYPLPRPIGIFFIAIGIYYFILIYRYKIRKPKSKAKNDKLSTK
jgi:uncharacterized membrane protein HdeD (DUF308 family)